MMKKVWIAQSCMRFFYRQNIEHFDSKNRRSLPKWSGGDLWAKFPHSPILHYAYSPLLEENNSANNRLPLGQFALFSRSWIFLSLYSNLQKIIPYFNLTYMWYCSGANVFMVSNRHIDGNHWPGCLNGG